MFEAVVLWTAYMLCTESTCSAKAGNANEVPMVLHEFFGGLGALQS